jgi:hypothetical protein
VYQILNSINTDKVLKKYSFKIISPKYRVKSIKIKILKEMKNSIITTLLICLCTSVCVCQNIALAPAEKAVIYFVRPSSLGFAINFSYFDSTKLIGKFNGPKYIRYECDPGNHLFWARSENKDFIEAEVEAGRIYFIEAIPRMGALKAAIELIPLNMKDQKEVKRVMDLLEKKPSESFTSLELEMETREMEDVIAKGMKKYREDKAKGVVFEKLEKSMYYSGPINEPVK